MKHLVWVHSPVLKVATMEKEDYREILQNYLKKDARDLGLGRRWWFQHDNDSKHKSKLVTKWLVKNKINVLEWPSQYPDLILKNLWHELNIRVYARRPKNLSDLEKFCKEEWQTFLQVIVLTSLTTTTKV